MTPTLFLLSILAITAAAWVISTTGRLVRSRRIARQAAALGLQFSRPDRFHLARRVAAKLPIPGAAEVMVRDVAYLTVPNGGLLCIMTASFTIGATGRRQHRRRVCAAIDGGKILEHFHMFPGAPSPETYSAAHRQLSDRIAANGHAAA